MHHSYRDSRYVLTMGALAGIAGGLAEIVWITAYAQFRGLSAATVAHEVTKASGLLAFFPHSSVVAGICIHMALAVALGLFLAGSIQVLKPRQKSPLTLYSLALAILGGVWVINFFVALPFLSPRFATLLPYSVTLISKLFFGLAAAQVLIRGVVKAPSLKPIFNHFV